MEPIPIIHVPDKESLALLVAQATADANTSSPGAQTSTWRAEKKTLIHFKGFGPSVMHPPRAKMIETLLNADIIEFDGDDYNEETFTFAFRVMVDRWWSDMNKKQEEKREEEEGEEDEEGKGSTLKPFPLLLSFKYSNAVERFTKSWLNFSVPIGSNIRIYLFAVDEDTTCAQTELFTSEDLVSEMKVEKNENDDDDDKNTTTTEATEIQLTGIQGSTSSEGSSGRSSGNGDGSGSGSSSGNEVLMRANAWNNSNQFQYVALGVFAVELLQELLQQTIDRKIVVWGGYKVIQGEFAVNLTRERSRRRRQGGGGVGGVEVEENGAGGTSSSSSTTTTTTTTTTTSASSSNPHLIWEYYHAVRTANGEVHHGKLLELDGHFKHLLVMTREP